MTSTRREDLANPTTLDLAPQRLAMPSDAARISELMRASVLDLFPHFYDEQQTASAAVHIAHIDMQLIEDGTYFVHEAGDEIVACGGWSKRAKLYTGSATRKTMTACSTPERSPRGCGRCSSAATGRDAVSVERYSNRVSAQPRKRASRISCSAPRCPASPSTGRSGFARSSGLR